MTNFRDDATSAPDRWMKPLRSDSLSPTRGAPASTAGARYTPNELAPGETAAPPRPLVTSFAQPTSGAPSRDSQATPPSAIPALHEGAQPEMVSPASDTPEYADVDAALRQAVAQSRRARDGEAEPRKPSRLVERDAPEPQLAPRPKPPEPIPCAHPAPEPEPHPVPQSTLSAQDAPVPADGKPPFTPPSAQSYGHCLPEADDDDDEPAEDAVPTERMAVPAPVPLLSPELYAAPRRWWIIPVVIVLLAAAALALWQAGVLDAWFGRELPSPMELLRQLFAPDADSGTFPLPTQAPRMDQLAPTPFDTLG